MKKKAAKKTAVKKKVVKKKPVSKKSVSKKVAMPGYPKIKSVDSIMNTAPFVTARI